MLDFKKLTPLHDELIVRWEKPETTTASGLHIPEAYARIQSNFTRGEVLAIGSKVWDIKVGDIVWVEGHRSGRRLTQYLDSECIVPQHLCYIKEEKEE